MRGRQHALEIFKTAVAAVQPGQLIPEQLSIDQEVLKIGKTILSTALVGKIYVIGAGKAAAAMAIETENILGEYLSDGLVITKYGHSLPCKKIKVVEGAHPLPDENCVGAVAQTMSLLHSVTEKDIVICLISGGASALWCDLPADITLTDMQLLSNAIVRSGATIKEMNTVRKHLSSIKGGQLVRYCNGAKVFSLIVSDVPGDDEGVIASGPTVADESTFREAYDILVKYKLINFLPQNILTHLDSGISGRISETPKPGDMLFNRTVNTIIGSNQIAVLEAGKKARELGYETYVNREIIAGNTSFEAKKLLLKILKNTNKKSFCIIQGGETTLKVTGKGKGGRNQHFCLVALEELMNEEKKGNSHNITILSGGTDGTDGPTEATGAVIDEGTIEKVKQKKLLIKEYLNNNDSYNFFNKTESLIITGPTQTNVMDLMIAIVDS